MIIRRYSGKSMEKIREVIANELGADAVIVHTETRRSTGSLPGMGKTVYEVIAATEAKVNTDDWQAAAAAAAGENSTLTTLVDIQREQYRGIRQGMKMIDAKLAEVDEWMARISSQSAAAGAGGGIGSNAGGSGGGYGTSTLLRNIHAEMRSYLEKTLHERGLSSDADTSEWFQVLSENISTCEGLPFHRNDGSGPLVYVIVGPTGVGKTTTLAKLASKCVLGMGLNIGLLTMDTFRIAGVDQLREYSELLGVELAVAFSGRELSRQLQNFAGKDVIFIDTPGRSQFDSFGINDIRKNLASLPRAFVLLTVGAGIRAEDAESVYASYSVLEPQALILSKTDEASRCDGLTRLLEISQLPIAYLTDGQRVPEDIHQASPGVVASLIMPEVAPPEPISIGAKHHG